MLKVSVNHKIVREAAYAGHLDRFHQAVDNRVGLGAVNGVDEVPGAQPMVNGRPEPVPTYCRLSDGACERAVIQILRDTIFRTPDTQLTGHFPSYTDAFLSIPATGTYTLLHWKSLTCISLKDRNSSFSKWEPLCYKLGDGTRVPVIECLISTLLYDCWVLVTLQKFDKTFTGIKTKKMACK